jgi:OOP family OmpA-OmpF porin
MVESLNRTLEHSLSRKAMQWRVEAWRTGKSFGEIVLIKTLLFRVEQAYLIDRKTGLLLQHVRAGDAPVMDADMISGMLTAIRDFARDSFHTGDAESLESLRVGELRVWIEQGPHAILAIVIRGNAPRELRRTMQDALETIHLQFAHVLESFAGDASTLDDAKATLETCLVTEYRADEKVTRRGSAWLVIGVVALALLVWAGFAYRARLRWGHYLDALRAEPGLVVVSTGRSRGRFVVEGLRDPLAREPAELLPPTLLTAEDVNGRWAPYQSLDPAIVVKRAREMLHTPDAVTLNFQNGVLSATGNASLDWIADARRLAPVLAGVRAFDPSGAYDAAGRVTIGAIESRALLFQKGAPDPAADQTAELNALVADVKRLEIIADAAGFRYKLDVVGHTDADGSEGSNVPLSVTRAQHVVSALSATPLPHLEMAASGVGSTAPAIEGRTEAENRKNRRVSVHVTRQGGK